MADNNNNILSYFESRVISLQAQINNLQELVNHYRAVLNDYKRQNRVDMPVDDFQHHPAMPKDEHVTL